MIIMMGNLFNKFFLGEFIHEIRTSLIEKISKTEIPDSTDLDFLLENLKNEFIINPLVLKEAIPTEPIETQIDTRNLFDDPYLKKVFKINLKIPFDGKMELFFCYSSGSTVVYVDDSVTINASHVSATIILNKLDSDKYQNAVRKIISDLNTNIPQINAGITFWNNDLEKLILQLIKQRREETSKRIDFMQKIGLKVNPKSNEFMIPSPVAMKFIPTLVSDISTNMRRVDELILQEDVYQDIKEVLYNVGRAIERKPSIYLNKHEEDLRDIFLLFLETRYESTSGVGEAFNKGGKTDILLKYAKDGSNLFVAECKFWKGQKNLFKGIDQLLGYLTHRDSKTALMIFVDQKELTSVISTIKTEIQNHNNFNRFLKESNDTSFSYEFILPDDSQKIIQIELMLFHFPK